MDTLPTYEGWFGAIIIALLFYIGYKIAIKKSSWDFSSLGKIESPLTAERGQAYAKWLLPILIGAAALYWAADAKVHPADIGNLSQKYWLQIFIVYGVIAAGIWLNADEKSAKVLQKALAGGVLVLLVGLPLYAWVQSPSSTPHVDRQFKTPLTSLPKASWPKMLVPAGGEVHISVPPYMHVDIIGNGITSYNVFRNGTECRFGGACTDGSLAWVRVENSTKEEIIISYAFASM